MNFFRSNNAAAQLQASQNAVTTPAALPGESVVSAATLKLGQSATTLRAVDAAVRPVPWANPVNQKLYLRNQ